VQVDVVTPGESLYSGEAREVYARSQEGEIGILEGHQPVLLALASPSSVRVRTSEGGSMEEFRIAGGFLEFRDGQLSVLADGLAEDA
jgi:F-type H+-transporting ATPase subunit epsilon